MLRPRSVRSASSDIPGMLKPYIDHGVYLDYQRDLTASRSVTGDCPFCQKEMRFNVTLDEGLWRCVHCNAGTAKGGGNVYTFLRILHDFSMKATTEDDYKTLATQRNLLYPNTLKAWGVCRSITDGTWLVPAYSPILTSPPREGGKIVQLYRYVMMEGKMRLKATTSLSHGLHGPDVAVPVGGLQRTKNVKTGPVYRCEGPWDGMALWEVLQHCKMGDEGELMPTGNPEASLLHQASVVAVPGCGVFQPAWASVLAGRMDISLYDNDHPQERPLRSGKFVQAALDGMQRALEVISHAVVPPSECSYLRWGDKTYHDPSLPHRYDIRDHIAGKGGTNTLIERIRALNDIFHRLQPIPQEWMPGFASSPGGMVLRQEECRDWKTLMNALRDVGKVTPSIERTFAAMLASILSVPSVGDQLWLMVIGPPSSFKTTLCEAISANRQYVLPKDTTTGIFSGWTAGVKEGENISMVGEMQNKTLVIKDGDTIMRSPNLAQIMSQFRALYDRCVRTNYRNKMSKDWEGLNTTVILCGTASLLEMDAAERGARYLTIDIQPKDDYNLEDEICLRVGHNAFRNMTIHANGTVESMTAPEVTRLKQLTSGYISYLRGNATALIEAVRDPQSTSIHLCSVLATFCSYMRCRPPKKQDEKVEREMPYRLTSQLVRLARGLAVVLNRPTLDATVMGHVRQIALDTARGKILGLCDYVRACGDEGVSSHILGQAIGESSDDTIKLLRFLRKIHAVEMIVPPSVNLGVVRVGVRPRWKLSPRLSALYDHIFS